VPLSVTERLSRRQRTVTSRESAWQRIVNPVCAPLRHSVYCTSASIHGAQGTHRPQHFAKGAHPSIGPQWLHVCCQYAIQSQCIKKVIHHILFYWTVLMNWWISGPVSLLTFQTRNLSAMLTTAACLYFHVNLSWRSLP